MKSKSKKPKAEVLVSYQYAYKHGTGFGCDVIKWSKPVDSEFILQITADLKLRMEVRFGCKVDVVILNIIKLPIQ